jgi:hypothetical protein
MLQYILVNRLGIKSEDILFVTDGKDALAELTNNVESYLKFQQQREHQTQLTK